MNNNEHEALIASSFVLRERRGRFRELLTNRKVFMSGMPNMKDRKRRRKYSQMMSNFEHWIDPRCKRLQVSFPDQHSEAKLLLAKYGAKGSAYVMSDDYILDGRIMELTEIFSHLEENNVYGTLISFGQVGIAYYEQCELVDLTNIILSVKNSLVNTT